MAVKIFWILLGISIVKSNLVSINYEAEPQGSKLDYSQTQIVLCILWRIATLVSKKF